VRREFGAWWPFFSKRPNQYRERIGYLGDLQFNRVLRIRWTGRAPRILFFLYSDKPDSIRKRVSCTYKERKGISGAVHLEETRLQWPTRRLAISSSVGADFARRKRWKRDTRRVVCGRVGGGKKTQNGPPPRSRLCGSYPTRPRAASKTMLALFGLFQYQSAWLANVCDCSISIVRQPRLVAQVRSELRLVENIGCV